MNNNLVTFFHPVVSSCGVSAISFIDGFLGWVSQMNVFIIRHPIEQKYKLIYLIRA